MTEAPTATLVARIPEIDHGSSQEPLPNFPEAFWWSVGPIHLRAALISPGGSHLFEMLMREKLEVELAETVLRYSFEKAQSLLGDESPIRLQRGFEAPGWQFDSLVALSPDVHRAHKVNIPELHERTLVVAPAYSFEVLPSLSTAEALSTQRAIAFGDLHRTPNPVARARYQTHGRTLGRQRAMATERDLLPQLAQLEGEPEHFVEVENTAGELAALRWSDGRFLAETDGRRVEFRTAEPFADWFGEFLRRPVPPDARRPDNLPGVGGRRLDARLTFEMSDATVADSLANWHVEQELDRLVEPDGPVWAVLRRSRQEYVQTHKRDDGQFDIEYRDGGSDRHCTSVDGVDLESVKRLFVLYGFNDASWRTVANWRPLRS